MPMVLRSRKSLRAGTGDAEEELPDTGAPVTARRSARPHRGRIAYEESDESDTESVPIQVMEETAEEADVKELKDCAVVLDRLQSDEKAKQEIEDREDMNRKGGKPMSRIPTFHKRSSGVGPNVELPVSKKDPPVPMAPPTEKAGSGSSEALKSREEAREKALPVPSVRLPKIGHEAPSPYTSSEQAAASARGTTFTLPKSIYEVVSPRPAIRAETRPESRLQNPPDQDKSEVSVEKPEDRLDPAVPHLPQDGSISQGPTKDTKDNHDAEVRSIVTAISSGDTKELLPTEILQAAEACEEKAIMDEEPPWESEQMEALELKDSRSSSDAECEADLAGDMSDGHDADEEKEHQEPCLSKSESPNESTSPAAPVKPDKALSTKSSKGSGCCSFAFSFFLPTTLLLLGGFGQHVWQYGLPSSVSQLTAQLELHWLEGFGFMPEPCSTDCRVQLVETIPIGLYQDQDSPSFTQSIADSWMHLLDRANSSVQIAAFYFTLRGSDLDSAGSTDAQGRKIFEHLKQLESKGVKLQIAVNAPQATTKDTAEFASSGAEVREVDMKAVTGGIVHTKLWVVDQKHFYLGSANMDWRSLSQVKEVGLSVEDCSCLALDASRIFGVYWNVAGASNSSLPPYWPARLSALSSSHNPLQLRFNGVPAQVYISSAPPQISARGRSDDLSSILSVINDANKFIHISVMDYLPLSEFTEPIRFWPAIDSALRSAACTRRVQVRLLVSCWKHSPAAMFPFLQSLLVLNKPPLRCDIKVAIFRVPSTPEQMKIPFARVNHAKYMVTDRVVYIGTSNWSENYFTQTAGVGLVVNQTGSEVKAGQETLQSQAEQLFIRDWRSEYVTQLSVDDVDVCPRGSH